MHTTPSEKTWTDGQILMIVKLLSFHYAAYRVHMDFIFFSITKPINEFILLFSSFFIVKC